VKFHCCYKAGNFPDMSLSVYLLQSLLI